MSDLALKSAGVACAVGSVCFAAFMFTHQQGDPRVFAIKDFAIFAQPNRLGAVEDAVKTAAETRRWRWRGHAVSIDMTPVGAVRLRHSETPDRRRQVRIVELNADNALLETREGYRRVRVGDQMPGLGKIIGIRRMDGYWIVVASLRSLAQAAPSNIPRAGSTARESPRRAVTALVRAGR